MFQTVTELQCALCCVQVLQLPVLTVAVLLVLSAWTQPRTQAALAAEIRNYCSTILGQTEAQERNCAGAPQKFTSSSRSTINLLCCLGSISTIEVKINYSLHLGKSMLFYIVKSVTSVTDEREVAKYVKQCYPEALQYGRNYTEEAYSHWLKNPSECLWAWWLSGRHRLAAFGAGERGPIVSSLMSVRHDSGQRRLRAVGIPACERRCFLKIWTSQEGLLRTVNFLSIFFSFFSLSLWVSLSFFFFFFFFFLVLFVCFPSVLFTL